MILKQSNVQTKAAITKSQRTNWIFKIHCSKIYKVKMLEKKKKSYPWAKTHSMERGYKYLTFIVVLVCVLNLCSVNFRKVFFFFFRQAKTCHTLTVAGMMSSAKNKPFLKGYLDFGKLVWASCYNRFCLLSPLLYSFLKDSRTVEALKRSGTRAKTSYYKSNYTQFLPYTF